MCVTYCVPRRNFLCINKAYLPFLILADGFACTQTVVPPKTLCQISYQKKHLNGKFLGERAVFVLIHMGTRSRHCENQGTIYHLLILGGVICCVIFVLNMNKELSHTIFQEDPQWSTNLAQQIYNILKSLGNLS